MLKLNPTADAENKLDKFMTTNKSPALESYYDLSQKSLAASFASAKMGDVLKAGPETLLGGIEADLAELCIGTKK